MSFINWGEESPEQKQIRRRFEEEQMMFEQAIMMANAANASAAAAAAAAGGSKLGESLPAYCGGDKKLVTYTFWGFDVLKDSRFAPTAEEFDNYVADGDADADLVARQVGHRTLADCDLGVGNLPVAVISDAPKGRRARQQCRTAASWIDHRSRGRWVLVAPQLRAGASAFRGIAGRLRGDYCASLRGTG